jgi:hypothetical protein
MDVETSLPQCDKMSSWSLVIERTREVINEIYELSNNSKIMEPPSGLESEFGFYWNSWDADTSWNNVGLESLLGINHLKSDLSSFNEIYY